jgi:hypothetical protein
MTEIILVPGPSTWFDFKDAKVKAAPEEKPPERPDPGERSASGTGQRPRQPKSTPVRVGPDTGWPPPKVLTSSFDRAALREAKSYNSWEELLSAVESNFLEPSALDGRLYARVTTTDAFSWDRAKKALAELGTKRLVVEYQNVAHGQSRKHIHGR